MISGIHHLNFLVRELPPNVRYLEKIFSIKPVFSSLQARQVRTATFKLKHSQIVLVCPLSNRGEPAKILDARGEGLFLVSFETLSLEQTLSYLAQHNIMPKGLRRKGLQDWQVIDLDLPPALGPIFQLCEQPQNSSI